MTTANQVLSEVEYDVVGHRPVRPDGVDKVTGRAQYGADLNLTGLLHGRVLRSPHAHARIRLGGYQQGRGAGRRARGGYRCRSPLCVPEQG